MPQPKLKLFWDLVSCPPSMSYTSPAEVLKDVRLFTSSFGVVTSIKAYWDQNKAQQPNAVLRAAMPSMGVNLIDCSSMQGYTDDALIKMLTVDALISAMDDPINPETAEKDIIMIISGDESVLYPISLLMFRNYTVFLVVPDGGNGLQPFQATRVFNWYQDVLSFKSNSNPEPVSNPAMASLTPQGWITNGTQASQSSPTSVLMSPSSPSVTSAPSAYTPPLRPVTSATTPGTTSGSMSGSLPSEPPVSRVPSALSSYSEAPVTRSLGIAHDEGVAATNTRTNISSAYSETQPIPAHQPVPEETTPSSNADDWGASSGWGANGGWEMTSANWDLDPVAPAPKPRESESKKSDVIPKQESRSKRETKPAQSTAKKDQPGRSSQTPKMPAMKTEPAAPTDPPMFIFDPLLQILREAEKQSIRRSQLGELLAKRKGLYQLAGVSGFGEFIALAVKKNLITVYGIDNHQQVKLRKRN